MSFPLKWIFFSEHLAAMNSIKNILVRFSHPHVPPYQFFYKKIDSQDHFYASKIFAKFFSSFANERNVAFVFHLTTKRWKEWIHNDMVMSSLWPSHHSSWNSFNVTKKKLGEKGETSFLKPWEWFSSKLTFKRIYNLNTCEVNDLSNPILV